MTQSTQTQVSVRARLAAAREDATRLRQEMKQLKAQRALELKAKRELAAAKKDERARARAEREAARDAKAAEKLAKVEARNAKAAAKLEAMKKVGKGVKAAVRKARKPSDVTVTTAEGTKTVKANSNKNKKAASK